MATRESSTTASPSSHHTLVDVVPGRIDRGAVVHQLVCEWEAVVGIADPDEVSRLKHLVKSSTAIIQQQIVNPDQGFGWKPRENQAPSFPRRWLNRPIRLSISSTKDARYVFSAAPAGHPEKEVILGTTGADIVSGGSGPFHGTLIGAYATSNGGNGSTAAFFSRWRYTPLL
ncbi:hypothetical protein B0I37DRAFT_356746 [Chaetomium sp. MPI-CAGE-AT-0009]|nr:hypothetical protein B0I37DRAFT_356746 [Chaetomium sp. MPI-CAGE-AT-0009]